MLLQPSSSSFEKRIKMQKISAKVTMRCRILYYVGLLTWLLDLKVYAFFRWHKKGKAKLRLHICYLNRHTILKFYIAFMCICTLNFVNLKIIMTSVTSVIVFTEIRTSRNTERWTDITFLQYHFVGAKYNSWPNSILAEVTKLVLITCLCKNESNLESPQDTNVKNLRILTILALVLEADPKKPVFWSKVSEEFNKTLDMPLK